MTAQNETEIKLDENMNHNHAEKVAIIQKEKTEDKPKKKNKGEVRNQDFIEDVAADASGIDKEIVKTAFNACWDAICHELELGNSIKLHGKGKFYLSKRSARMGRNPLTGEEYEVPKREAMAFQTSPTYAKRLRERRKELTGQYYEDSADTQDDSYDEEDDE